MKPAKAPWVRAIQHDRYEHAEDDRLHIVFRIRRRYLDEILAGTKKKEIRRASDYWRKRAAALYTYLARSGGKVGVGVFVCGTDVHRYELVGCGLAETPEQALGREPTLQGRKDLGDGPVIVFVLGNKVS